MIEEFESNKRPKAPKKIRTKGIRGFLGVISPALYFKYLYAGDEEIIKFYDEIRKYNNFKRKTTKLEWRLFYRNYRIDRRKSL